MKYRISWLALWVVVALLWCGAALLPAVSVQAQAPLVVVATVDAEITAGTVAYLERALELAVNRGADHFVLELNTPGGLLKATEEISRMLVDTPVSTTVYVHRDTGWAFSAGVFLLLSGDTAAAHPNASLGAATPVTGSGELAGDKVTNATAEWIGTLATRGNRDVEAVKGFVTEASTLSGQAAFDAGLIDVLAISTEELLSLQGYGTAEVERVVPNTIDAILALLSLPYLVPLLLSLGALGIFLTFRTGEIESFGVIGFILLLLGLWGTGAITISTLGLLLLIVGVALLAIEFVFSPGFGVVGGAGVVALLVSMVTFANEPFFPSYFLSTIFYMVLGVWAGVALLMVLLGKLSLSAQLQPIQVGRESLYGKVVPVVAALEPAGRVMVDGESYLARTEETSPVPIGTMVKIVKMEGNTILVEPITDN